MDLIDFFRGVHSWRKLQNILSRLPVSSAYREAVLEDPEVVAVLLEQDEASGPGRPPLSEFSAEVALLSDIKDRLGEVVGAIIASAGGKPPTVQPSPRPTTGVARAREQAAQQRHLSLVDEVKAAQERWEAARSGGDAEGGR